VVAAFTGSGADTDKGGGMTCAQILSFIGLLAFVAIACWFAWGLMPEDR
jgi:hypothetical protein